MGPSHKPRPGIQGEQMEEGLQPGCPRTTLIMGSAGQVVADLSVPDEDAAHHPNKGAEF